MATNPSPRPQTNGWSAWEKHVLIEIKRLADAEEGTKAVLSQIKQEIAVLKVKASWWGAGAGGLLAGLVELMRWIMSHNRA